MGATNIDLDGIIDPSLLQAQVRRAGIDGETLGVGPNATTGATLLDTEVIKAGEDDDIIDTTNLENIEGNTISTSLLSQASDQSGDQASGDNISTATDSASIDVESVTPDFVTDQWRSDNIGFSANNSTWQKNTDGTYTQTLLLDKSPYGVSGADAVDVQYKWDAQGNFIGLSDGTEEAVIGDTITKDRGIAGDAEDAGFVFKDDDGKITGIDIDGYLKSVSSDIAFIEAELREKGQAGETLDIPGQDDGSKATAIDTNGDGTFDSYAIRDGDNNISVITNDEYDATYGKHAEFDSESQINTDPITLDDGNFAYAFDSNGDGEIDTYRIVGPDGIEIETISADDYTGTDYVAGSGDTTGTVVTADDASTDGSYLGIINPLADDDVWKTGSEDADGDGIPDGILKTGLSADQIETFTFADGSTGYIYTVNIPSNPLTGDMSYSMYWNKNGQLVDSEGKGAEGMVIPGSKASDGSDGSEGANESGENNEDGPTDQEMEDWRKALGEILVDTDSDITDEFAGLYNEIAGLFATGDDGILTADDKQQLIGFFNNMIEQGNDTGVILSSKTMTDYFNLVKEYTGQYNGTISDADTEQFLADWLAESKLFVSGLDNSQKWSLDNITDHSQYENLQNLIELVYGEGRTLTAEEAMRYLTDYSFKDDKKGWLYGVGGDSILNTELTTTNFLVGQMVLNAEGTDRQYVTDFWLSNDDLNLEAYGLTLESIAEAWDMTVEELKVNTAKSKKNKKQKKSTGSFFAPKDVVRIGDEDPGSSPQTITGKGGRSRTKPNTLLGGSVMTSTLTGSN